MPQLSFHSPMGALTVTEEDGFIVSLDWGWAPESVETPVLKDAKDQVLDYFDGKRRDFDLPLKPYGTAFQQKVWEQLAAIPFGHVRRYGDIALTLGTSARPVGGACGRNPIPIIIPCHRVVGGGGGLGGYSGLDGIDSKRFLLSLEGH